MCIRDRVSSLRSVSSRRLPGRTCPRGRWLGVAREAALAVAKSSWAPDRAVSAAGSAGPDPCVFDRGADIGLSVFDGAAGGADLGKGAGFGGVGYEPVGVVALVGVAVQGVEGEVFPGVFEVCLLYTSPSPRDRTRSRM